MLFSVLMPTTPLGLTVSVASSLLLGILLVLIMLSSNFSLSWILRAMNSNVLSLISKILRVDFIKNFRPIVVANCRFKIISKILADMLVIIASKIISSNQYDFVQGKNVQDCICITFEAINILSKKAK